MIFLTTLPGIFDFAHLIFQTGKKNPVQIDRGHGITDYRNLPA